MSETSHPYEDWDASYVLGALSPAERREYESHLRECEHCSIAVAELAAMPSLLARVPARDALALLDDDAPASSPVPDVLPGLLAAVRTTRRRRRIQLGVGAAAAAVLAAVLIIPAALPSPPDTVQIELTATEPSPLAADVELIPERWGTRIEMTCSYRSRTNGGAATWQYELTAIDRSGDEFVVSTWEAGPGDVVHTTGTIDVPVAEIAAVEVRSPVTGDVLLRGTASVSP